MGGLCHGVKRSAIYTQEGPEKGRCWGEKHDFSFGRATRERPSREGGEGFDNEDDFTSQMTAEHPSSPTPHIHSPPPPCSEAQVALCCPIRPGVASPNYSRWTMSPTSPTPTRLLPAPSPGVFTWIPCPHSLFPSRALVLPSPWPWPRQHLLVEQPQLWWGLAVPSGCHL